MGNCQAQCEMLKDDTVLDASQETAREGQRRQHLLTLTNVKPCNTTIGSNTVTGGLSKLTHVRADPSLSTIQSIGDDFFFGCYGLVSVDLAGFTNVTVIGDCFLHHCVSLASVNLEGLANVTTVGDGFLQGCFSLRTLDLTPMSKLTRVGDSFLRDCTKLTSMQLSGKSRIAVIGDDFMWGCASLRDVDLSAIESTASIGHGFLNFSRALKKIDTTPLQRVTRIGDGFLAGCSTLTEANLDGLDHVSQIGNGFLAGCGRLTTIDLEPLSHVRSIGAGFMCRCRALETIDVKKLEHLKSVGEHFMAGCSRMDAPTVLPSNDDDNESKSPHVVGRRRSDINFKRRRSQQVEREKSQSSSTFVPDTPVPNNCASLMDTVPERNERRRSFVPTAARGRLEMDETPEPEGIPAESPITVSPARTRNMGRVPKPASAESTPPSLGTPVHPEHTKDGFLVRKSFGWSDEDTLSQTTQGVSKTNSYIDVAAEVA